MQLIYSFRYPQFLWSKRISKILRGISKKHEINLVIDAPCGDGIISYWLPRQYNKLLVDINENNIKKAKNLLPNNNSIYQDDLYNIKNNLKSNHKLTVWMLINSLYLLPDITKLAGLLKDTSKYVIGIFPYQEHENYLHFGKRNYLESININIMSKEETISYFEINDFKNTYCEDLTFISNHKYKSNSGLINYFLGKLFIFLDFIAPKKKGAYWLGVFEKEDN